MTDNIIWINPHDSGSVENSMPALYGVYVVHPVREILENGWQPFKAVLCSSIPMQGIRPSQVDDGGDRKYSTATIMIGDTSTSALTAFVDSLSRDDAAVRGACESVKEAFAEDPKLAVTMADVWVTKGRYVLATDFFPQLVEVFIALRSENEADIKALGKRVLPVLLDMLREHEEDDYMPTAWGFIVVMFGSALHKTPLLNALLRVLEAAFNSKVEGKRLQAHKAWRRLIANFAVHGTTHRSLPVCLGKSSCQRTFTRSHQQLQTLVSGTSPTDEHLPIREKLSNPHGMLSNTFMKTAVEPVAKLIRNDVRLIDAFLMAVFYTVVGPDGSPPDRPVDPRQAFRDIDKKPLAIFLNQIRANGEPSSWTMEDLRIIFSILQLSGSRCAASPQLSRKARQVWEHVVQYINARMEQSDDDLVALSAGLNLIWDFLQRDAVVELAQQLADKFRISGLQRAQPSPLGQRQAKYAQARKCMKLIDNIRRMLPAHCKGQEYLQALAVNLSTHSTTGPDDSPAKGSHMRAQMLMDKMASDGQERAHSDSNILSDHNSQDDKNVDYVPIADKKRRPASNEENILTPRQMEKRRDTVVMPIKMYNGLDRSQSQLAEPMEFEEKESARPPSRPSHADYTSEGSHTTGSLKTPTPSAQASPNTTITQDAYANQTPIRQLEAPQSEEAVDDEDITFAAVLDLLKSKTGQLWSKRPHASIALVFQDAPDLPRPAPMPVPHLHNFGDLAVSGRRFLKNAHFPMIRYRVLTWLAKNNQRQTCIPPAGFQSMLGREEAEGLDAGDKPRPATIPSNVALASLVNKRERAKTLQKVLVRSAKGGNGSDGFNTFPSMGSDCPWSLQVSNVALQFLKAHNRNEKLIRSLVRLIRGQWNLREMGKVEGDSFLKTLRVGDLQVFWSLYLDAKKNQFTQVIKIWAIVNSAHRCPELQKIKCLTDRLTPDILEQCRSPLKIIDGKHTIYLPREFEREWRGSRPFAAFRSDADTISPELDLQGLDDLMSYVRSHHLTNTHIAMLKEGRLANVELPLGLSPEEEAVVSDEHNMLIIGRSGTGKTTVCLYKMCRRHVPYLENPEIFETEHHDGIPRQLMITVSSRLCDTMKDYYARLLGSYEDCDWSDSLNEAVSFKTFRQCLLELDNVTPSSFFQPRMQEAARDLESLVSRTNSTSIPAKEMDFGKFELFYYPHLSSQVTKRFSAAFLWTEYTSVIKGSGAALLEPARVLSEGAYLELANSRSSTASTEERQSVYDSYKTYENIKRERRHYDLHDAVAFIYQQLQGHKLKDHEGEELIRKLKATEVDYMYVDEVQDLTEAQLTLLKYLCRNPDGFCFAGDTAQTITSGVGFRFETLRHILFNDYIPHFLRKQPTASSHKASAHGNNRGRMSDAFPIHSLTQNYPTIDKLKRESALCAGAIPVFLRETSPERLRWALFGKNEQQTGDQDAVLGAEQVVILRTEKSRKLVETLLPDTLILDIIEAKGLEFQDVLLFNFFEDSTFRSWRVLLGIGGQMSKGPVKAPEFDERQHHALLCELKTLYVAVTRAKKRLWFFDQSKEKREIMLDYWERSGVPLSYITAEDASNATLARRSSVDEWNSRGHFFKQKDMLDQALRSFRNARNTREVDVCIAKRTYAEGLRAAGLGDVPAANAKFLDAASKFEKVDLLTDAGQSYFDAKKWIRAVHAFEEDGDLENAMRTCLRGELVEDFLRLSKSAKCPKKLKTDISHRFAVRYHTKKAFSMVAKMVENMSESESKRKFYEVNPVVCVSRLSKHLNHLLHQRYGYWDQLATLHLELGHVEAAAHTFVRQRLWKKALDALRTDRFTNTSDVQSRLNEARDLILWGARCYSFLKIFAPERAKSDEQLLSVAREVSSVVPQEFEEATLGQIIANEGHFERIQERWKEDNGIAALALFSLVRAVSSLIVDAQWAHVVPHTGLLIRCVTTLILELEHSRKFGQLRSQSQHFFGIRSNPQNPDLCRIYPAIFQMLDNRLLTADVEHTTISNFAKLANQWLRNHMVKLAERLSLTAFQRAGFCKPTTYRELIELHLVSALLYPVLPWRVDPTVVYNNFQTPAVKALLEDHKALTDEAALLRNLSTVSRALLLYEHSFSAPKINALASMTKPERGSPNAQAFYLWHSFRWLNTNDKAQAVPWVRWNRRYSEIYRFSERSGRVCNDIFRFTTYGSDPGNFIDGQAFVDLMEKVIATLLLVKPSAAHAERRWGYFLKEKFNWDYEKLFRETLEPLCQNLSAILSRAKWGPLGRLFGAIEVAAQRGLLARLIELLTCLLLSHPSLLDKDSLRALGEIAESRWFSQNLMKDLEFIRQCLQQSTGTTLERTFAGCEPHLFRLLKRMGDEVLVISDCRTKPGPSLQRLMNVHRDIGIRRILMNNSREALTLNLSGLIPNWTIENVCVLQRNDISGKSAEEWNNDEAEDGESQEQPDQEKEKDDDAPEMQINLGSFCECRIRDLLHRARKHIIERRETISAQQRDLHVAGTLMEQRDASPKFKDLYLSEAAGVRTDVANAIMTAKEALEGLATLGGTSVEHAEKLDRAHEKLETLETSLISLDLSTSVDLYRNICQLKALNAIGRGYWNGFWSKWGTA
ncbi:uncharacterized protein EV422DRAFT_503134 [Fimicolochytrium jonesii]|uniref:uncharacterized protein n=1 Tax=Fimicolochytrium jonesii TaxID=1396493 RepID=UPI0022FE9A6D|nr:uncharacterized protein EV422DRAFT_503134 [Fimicolochytrium jonesii]KAI8825760.1 hypothetical protein EV422DRAFT_503134 [Fimicolochytrium jonesii]